MVKLSSYQDKAIIFIDGECEFCNRTALLIIKYDKKDKFRFASQQSEIWKNLIKENNYNGNVLSTIILIENEKVLTKTTALIEIAKHLVGLPKLLVVFKIIPVKIRDFLYDIFSKYRYRIFGKKEDCKIPSSDVRKKYLYLYKIDEE